MMNRAFETAVAVIGSTTSAAVSLVVFAALAYRRDGWMVCFCIGSALNGIFSMALKKCINQERPHTSGSKQAPKDKGMPSTHAMELSFMVVTTAWKISSNSNYWKVVLCCITMILYVLLSVIYRIRSKLHTLEQVAVGLVLGTVTGSVWSLFCNGNNPWNIQISPWLVQSLMNENGKLAMPWLVVAFLLALVCAIGPRDVAYAVMEKIKKN